MRMGPNQGALGERAVGPGARENFLVSSSIWILNIQWPPPSKSDTAKRSLHSSLSEKRAHSRRQLSFLCSSTAQSTGRKEVCDEISVVVRKDITGAFLLERLRFNHLKLLL